MKNLILGLVLFFGFTAFASVQILKVTGAAATDTSSDGTVSIFGGTAGTACTDTGPCNSCQKVTCATAPFCACNTTRITDSQAVTITVKSDSKSNLPWAISNGQGIPTIIFDKHNVAGGDTILETTWGALCNAAIGQGTCETRTLMAALEVGLTDGSTMTESVFIQLNVLNPTTDTIDDCAHLNGGVCNFKIGTFKGNPFMEEFGSDEAFPGFVKAIRIYASPKDFESASPLAPFTQDLALDEYGNLKSSNINLRSKVTNYFRVATVDIANNVYNFTSDANITDPLFGRCTLPLDNNSKDGCRYRFIPQTHK